MRNEPVRAVPKPIDESKVRRRRAKARGKYHEHAVADKLGGRVVPFSGAGVAEKGDVRVDDLPTPLFVETKHVGERVGRGAESVSVPYAWLEKTVLDAEAVGALPVVAVRLSGGKGFYVARAQDFEALVNQLKDYYQRAQECGEPLTFEACLERLKALYEQR